MQLFARYFFLLFFCVARTVIVAVPGFFAVIFPVLLTVATALLPDDHFTGQYTPDGLTIDFNVFVPPTYKTAFDALIEMLVGFKSFTFIVTDFFSFLFAFAVTVILTFPAFFPFTTPLDDTVAIFLLPDLNVTALLAFDGLTDFTDIVACPLISIVFAVTLSDIFVGFFDAASLGIAANATAITTTKASNPSACFLIFFFITHFPQCNDLFRNIYPQYNINSSVLQFVKEAAASEFPRKRLPLLFKQNISLFYLYAFYF